MLEGFPFPKLYVYQSMDNRRPIREVVDGQQRFTTILDFFHNRFALSNISQRFSGLRFEDLDEEVQDRFRLLPVQTDLIVSATKAELLEMFRRMNSYTVPLNAAEKRHSQFQGAFKWHVTDLAKTFSPLLEQWGVLTDRQILRMADSEFLAELTMVLLRGVESKSESTFRKIYKEFDTDFPNAGECQTRVRQFFEVLGSEFAPLQGTFMMKPYALYSLFAAMMHLRYGIPNGNDLLGTPSIGVFYRDAQRAISGLTLLASAHEIQEEDGPYGEYVTASLSTTTKAAQRTVRARAMIQFLI